MNIRDGFEQTVEQIDFPALLNGNKIMIEPIIKTKFVKNREKLLSKGVDNFSGCYAFYRGATCLYVGKSINVLERVLSHAASSTGRLALWVWKCEFGNETLLEKDLIRELKPKNNGKAGLNSIPAIVDDSIDAILVGESKDKTCYRLYYKHHSFSTLRTIHKSRVTIPQ